MSDITETRRKRLELLALDRGSNWKELAKDLGFKTGAYLSQIRSGVRTINEKTARKWERKLKLSTGWFDIDTSNSAKGPVEVSPELAADVATACRRIVDEELRGKISYAKFHRLVSSAYVHSARVGKVDEEYIRNLVGLMAPD